MLVVCSVSSSIYQAFSSLWYLLCTDLHFFQNYFPHTWWLLFFVIRILPPVTLVLLLASPIRKGLLGSLEYCYARAVQLPNKFLIVFLIAALIRIWYAVTLPLILSEGDAMGRLEQTIDWFNHPVGLPGGGNWLPLHHWLLGLPSVFGLGIIPSSRFVTLCFGLATFPVFYKLVKTRFNRTIALLSCLLLALNPFHIKYSVITMTEVPFLFFLLAALLSLFKFIETDKRKFLLLSSLLLNCASLLRFEAWILSVLIPFFLLYYKKGWKPFLLFMFLNGTAPVLFGFNSLISTGDFFYGVTVSNNDLRDTYALIKDAHAYILHKLMADLVYPFWMFAFLWVGIFLAIKKRVELPWLALALFSILLITYRVLNHQNEPAWRYFSTGLFLALPFTAYGLWGVCNSQSTRVLLTAAVVLLLVLGISTQYSQTKNQQDIPQGFMDAANWVKQHRNAGDKFIYDGHGVDLPMVDLVTNGRYEEMYFPAHTDMREYALWGPFTDSTFLNWVNEPAVKFLFYQRGTEVDSMFNRAQVQTQLQLKGPKLDSVYSNINYRIYRIKH